MAGSLWRQAIGSDEAIELTHPHGAYDYQPDVAPDGRSVVFSRYDGERDRALAARSRRAAASRQLTSGGAVNVEPRLSPDGKRIAWVSTQGTGHFNLFIADIGPTACATRGRCSASGKSTIARYYYSAFDHAHESVLVAGRQAHPLRQQQRGCVGHRRHLVGGGRQSQPTGARCSARKPAGARGPRLRPTASAPVRQLPRPAVAPALADDARRRRAAAADLRRVRPVECALVAGRRAHRLHQQRAGQYEPGRAGCRRRRADADHRRPSGDTRAAAGAADARHSRRTGPQRSGARRRARQRRQGRCARIDAWMHADDGFDRALQSSETHYFHCASPCTLEAPAGRHRDLGAARLSLSAVAADREARRRGRSNRRR